MMRTPHAVLALLVAGAVHAAEPAAHPNDPAPPELRLQPAARPLAMRVDLTLEPDRETFDGEVGIDLELLEPASFLWLNASRLEIGKARLAAGGEKWEARAVPGGEEFVGFDFGRQVAAGPATLTIAYRGKLDAVQTEGIFRQRDGEDWYAFTQFESTFARRAFPCFDEPSYRTPWTLTLRVRADHVAVANTPMVAERAHSGGMKVVEFAPTPSLPSYLVAFGVGRFAFVDAGSWGKRPTAVRIVVPRGHEARAAFAAEIVGPLLETLEEYFGIPYPFAKLDNLTIPHTVGFGAMENPGLVTYVDTLMLMDPAAASLQQKRRLASVVAHENAHMWFGDLVTPAWWDDIWLNEGFASWMGGKAVATWKPEWRDADDDASRRGGAMGADSLASSRPVRRPIRDRGDIISAFDGISYSKGASLLSMFEAWMGAERFRAGIQGYLRKHSWGNATSDDFVAALAAAGAPEVASSFASFLDQAGVPVVTVAVSCEGDGAVLDLAQRRYVPLGSPVSADQRWQVPVSLRYGAGERSARARVVLDERRESVALDFCPEWVQANDGGLGYYVSEYQGELLARLGAAGERLPSPEQVALASDANQLFASGDLEPAALLGLLPHLAASEHRSVVEAALENARGIGSDLVPEELSPNYRRFLLDLFGERGRALGFVPRAGESQDDTLLRPQVIALLANAGGDAALQAEARRLTESWLADRGAVSPEMVGTVLRAAARQGDVALFDRLAEAAAAEKDRRRRQEILGALGGFRDPAAVARALALVLSDAFDVRETTRIAWFLSQERETRPLVFAWVQRSFDALVTALPELSAAGIVWTTAGFCEQARRDEVAAFFHPRLEKLTGGRNNLEEVLDVIDICIAYRERQQPGVAAFLRDY